MSRYSNQEFNLAGSEGGADLCRATYSVQKMALFMTGCGLSCQRREILWAFSCILECKKANKIIYTGPVNAHQLEVNLLWRCKLSYGFLQVVRVQEVKEQGLPEADSLSSGGVRELISEERYREDRLPAVCGLGQTEHSSVGNERYDFWMAWKNHFNV